MTGRPPFGDGDSRWDLRPSLSKSDSQKPAGSSNGGNSCGSRDRAIAFMGVVSSSSSCPVRGRSVDSGARPRRRSATRLFEARSSAGFASLSDATLNSGLYAGSVLSSTSSSPRNARSTISRGQRSTPRSSMLCTSTSRTPSSPIAAEADLATREAQSPETRDRVTPRLLQRPERPMNEPERRGGLRRRLSPFVALLALIGGIERLLGLPMRGLIWFYRRAISPLLPPACRFYPSCSAYADESLKRFGLVRGGALMVWRLLRCQPFSRGGYDPVPGSIPPKDSANCRSHHADEDSSRCCV